MTRYEELLKAWMDGHGVNLTELTPEEQENFQKEVQRILIHRPKRLPESRVHRSTPTLRLFFSPTQAAEFGHAIYRTHDNILVKVTEAVPENLFPVSRYPDLKLMGFGTEFVEKIKVQK